MKVSNTHYPLTSSANRIALLVGITAGTVKRPEVEAAVLKDSEKRAYRKPVVAEGIRFESVTDAAKSIVSNRSSRLNKYNFFRAVQSEQKRIARMCNQDCWEGYYWSE